MSDDTFSIPREARLGTLLVALLATACLDVNNPNSTSPPPVITTQPTSLTVTAGSPATFSVTATGDSLAYQWYKNTAVIAGATSTTYTIASAAVSDAGTYQVVVSGRSAAVASDTVALTVVVPPVIVAYKLTSGIASSTNETFTSATPDESAVLVTTGADLTLINATVSKTGHSTSSTASQATGVNAAIRVTSGAKATLVGTNVRADSLGSTGLFATGASSIITGIRGSVATTFPLTDAVAATLGGSISLDDTPLRTGSATLARASGASTITLRWVADTLTGNLVSDATSSISATLASGSRLNGQLQGVALTIDSTSTWNVTATSTLTSFSAPGAISGSAITNIIGNGYTVSYAAALPANAVLGGRTYTLIGGGMLVPR
jgi:hypothetical protein